MTRMSPPSAVNPPNPGSAGPVSDLQRLASMQPQVSPLHTSFPKVSPGVGRPESAASDKSEASRPSSSSGTPFSIKQERDADEDCKDFIGKLYFYRKNSQS